ncbi:eukaryotic translation initiation factor 4E-binding protein 3 isoform X1 [Diceros bicornis minor]|uniref:eukaryotic translation initiation factor 4E-binding protein 3 isoform X1 n=1 Tax=Diceros bicornis minor TaxID=77932 RepID=UPI0026ECF7E5|nr:eukaryotic translation initiation factor 4E-binding protein 3 isoform X1 [Diceros bicornis minor]
MLLLEPRPEAPLNQKSLPGPAGMTPSCFMVLSNNLVRPRSLLSAVKASQLRSCWAAEQQPFKTQGIVTPRSLKSLCLGSQTALYPNSCLLPSPYPLTGTRIIYDRKFLLECKNSPIARTPPCCLPQIPGVTTPPTAPPSKLEELKEQETEEEIPDDAQFEMDI